MQLKLKLLIIGKTGQLGSALIKDAIALGHEVIAPSRQELDISDKKQFLHTLTEHKLDVVINTAAFLDVYACEIEPENAFKYNCIFPIEMAKTCFEHKIKFVTFSTDYVFDGKKSIKYIETDSPRPLQVYGLSKLAGEYGILSYNKNSVIIRTCGLYGNRNKELNKDSKYSKDNFVNNRIKDSQTKNRIEISNEQTVCPTFAGDLSKATLKLIEYSDIHGVYHLVNEGSCTWYEFAKEIFDILDIPCEVVPVNRGGFFGGVTKPLYSVLENKRASEQYGIILPHWKDALKRYLDLKYDESRDKT